MIKLISPRLALNYWSIRIGLLAGGIAALEPAVPALAQVLPANWGLYATAAIAVARVIKQPGINEQRDA
ncbi:DUF7940 domain-containing protein [Rivihabitans pingtungensis]|uniref:Holin n=1 Tax=Rivihabitans pingtungensis TaxID=1054498 RepID=A0A318KN49_9NEIS|nr:hypothetical protein [Rivihabitans pingtungensis]PXX79159.1 hypothetical protein DFR34_10849 [Rivihabitans pingtungensis]